MLSRSRWTDTAHIIADRTGRTDVPAPTGRGGWRVDQAWITEGLVPAVIDRTQIDIPGPDHKSLCLVLNTELANPSPVVILNHQEDSVVTLSNRTVDYGRTSCS